MNGMLEFYFAGQPSSNQPRARKTIIRRRNPAIGSPYQQSSFEDPDLGVSGIFDTLKAIVSPYVAQGGARAKAEFQSRLDDAQRQVESKVGTFLTTGQTLVGLRNRSQAQQNSTKPEVRNRAIAISAKATALLNNYDSIKSQSLDQVKNLVALKTQMQTDPVFNFDNPEGMGTRVVELFNKYKSLVAQNVAGSAQMAARIVAHNKEVESLASDVDSLESYAQGKGWAVVEQIGSGYKSVATTGITVAVIGGLAYLVFMTGGFRKK